MWRKVLITSAFSAIVLAALWWWIFALKPQTITTTALLAQYEVAPTAASDFVWRESGPRHMVFEFSAPDGDRVFGRIELPAHAAERYPVLLGISAMGNSAERWWAAELNGTATVTQVHRLRAMALDAGYAVVVMDARFHGLRKKAERPLKSIMRDLHWWGDKADYETMVRGTVMDWRQLLGHLHTLPALDLTRIKVAGYSMGAQVALLLAAVDSRVDDVIAIVPPHIGDETAVVAPKNIAGLLRATNVVLLTANQDEYATRQQNELLFAALGSKHKRHIQYDSGHLLPSNYPDDLYNAFAVTEAGHHGK